jgi:4-diphosphocytidyl-2-C-methyl-D-erythritol kinase
VFGFSKPDAQGGRPGTLARTIVVQAPARVFLTIQAGPGDDDLGTIFQAVDLSDAVEVRAEGAGVDLAVSGGDAEPDEQRMVLEASRAYLSAAGLPHSFGLRIRLEKNIPPGAGLATAASQAAATLKALDRICESAVPRSTLARIGAQLGPEVLSFLAYSPLVVERCSEGLLEAQPPLRAVPGLVVMPRVTLASRSGPAGPVAARPGGPGSPTPTVPRPRYWESVAALARNDFESSVLGLSDEVGQALASLRATDPLLCLLAAGGPSCFALYASEADVDRAETSLPQWRWPVARFRTLSAWPDIREI